MAASTPEELVSAYESLADVILSVKKTEKDLVLSILGATYQHAQATVSQIQRKLESGQSAQADIERLAALVSQLGNEGDAAVAGVRKRLMEGGHHHNAQGEAQGIYDAGFVVVTKASKKVFLDTASSIGRMARNATASSLKGEWDKVESEYKKLTQ